MLAIGGTDDPVSPISTQRQMTELIPCSRLIRYLGYGRGNDQENPDYNAQVRRLAQEVWCKTFNYFTHSATC